MTETRQRPWYSSLLFARPSWLSGLSRLFDWGATLNEYNRSPTPDDADYAAIASDWCAIGGDIRSLMDESGARLFGDQYDGDEAESGQIECTPAGSHGK
jgi:hypothetical protein